MKFYSTKTYGCERGLSAAFRQWRADSHCKYLHGYALGFRFVFGADTLDERNWVYDFGGCKWIKELLENTFDHRTVVAVDDPQLANFKRMHETGTIQLRLLDHVGCEAFASYIFNMCAPKVSHDTKGRVKLMSVECFEHSANSAIRVAS